MNTPPIYFASALVVAVIIIILNSYVLFLFHRKRSLRSHSNIILISLTLSDLMTGLVVIPFTVVAGMLNYLPFEEYAGLFIFSDIFIVFSAAITIINLNCIILDRYLSLCHPLYYSNTHKKSNIIKFVVLVWFLALLCTCIRLIWLGPIINFGFTDPGVLINATYYDRIYSIVGFALYCLLCLLMLCAFCRMFWSIRKFRTHRMKFLVNSKDSSNMKSEWKAVLVFGIMFLIFLACWTPMVTIRFLDDIGAIKKPPPRVLLQILVFIRFFSSLCDPILYTFYKLDFQVAVKEDKRIIAAYLPSLYKFFGRKQKLKNTGSDADGKGCINSSFQSIPYRTKMTQNTSESSSKSPQGSHTGNGVKLNAASLQTGSPHLQSACAMELPSSHYRSPAKLRVPDFVLHRSLENEICDTEEDFKNCNTCSEREDAILIVNNHHFEKPEQQLEVTVDVECRHLIKQISPKRASSTYSCEDDVIRSPSAYDNLEDIGAFYDDIADNCTTY